MKKLLLSLLMLVSLQAKAVGVLDLSGDYIRIGVSDYGTIGSKGNTSPGILYDNTGTGTFNTAYDYLTPGTPFEGWTVKFTNTDTLAAVSNSNNNTGAVQVTGGVLTDYSGVAYNGTTFDKRAVWTGSTVNYDLLHDVHFNNNQKFIDITTVLDAKVNMTNLYFGRYTDPDARAAAGDSSRTTNTLGFDPIPATQVVFSEALVSKYALGLYSAASNVGAGISSSWTTDPTQYYNGVNNGTGDYTIGLGFYVPTVAIGDRITFQYAYIFGPSTLDAGATAVVSGAGGGTAGVVPGCVTDCEMPGVTPPSAPTVVSSVTEYAETTATTRGTTVMTAVTTTGTPVATTVDTYASQRQAKTVAVTQTLTTTTITPTETIRTYTTPVTVTTTRTPTVVDTYSDASVVRTVGTAVVTATTADEVTSLTIDSHLTDVAAVDNLFSTKIDQYSILRNANKMYNQQLLSSVDRRINGQVGPYFIANGQRSNTNDGYKLKASRFGLGYDKAITDRLSAGIQVNYIQSDLNGIQAGGSLDKTSVNVYSTYDVKNWLLASDAGFVVNRYKTNHSIAELGLANNSSADGYDVWLANRLYTPSLKGFRPFIGSKVQHTNIDAVTESGDALTAVEYGNVSSTKVTGLYGVRYDYAFNRVNVNAEASSSSDNIDLFKAGVSFKPTEKVQGGLEVSQQRSEGYKNDTISAEVRWFF